MEMSNEYTTLVRGIWTRRLVAVAITGALALGGVATVAAANGPGAANIDPVVAPQQGPPEGTPTGQPEGIPPEDVGGQSENGNGGPPEGVGRPDGVGVAGNGDMPELPTLPEEASDQARDALEAVVELHQKIAERIDAIRDMPAGPERGEAVSEIAKDFGEQFRALAEALADNDGE
jgi:hypothetical protein